jgi:hypothetical protein
MKMMMKQVIFVGVLSVMISGLATAPIQADFIQCPNAGNCDGTDNSDVINGAPNVVGENIRAGLGNDFIFAGDGDEDSFGEEGDDVIFGGFGEDEVLGGPGNDILFAGADTGQNAEQLAQGDEGNDSFNVFVGEILGCLSIEGGEGFDAANLIGFGPYSATLPFGQPGFGAGFIVVVDPITNGQIAIMVSENDDTGTEAINGLLSPNVTIVNVLPEGCTT